MTVPSGAAFLIPAGTWAEWVGAVATSLAVWLGVYTWNRDRQRTFELQDSEQARRVGAVLSWEGDKLQAKVINASDLPLRQISPTAAARVRRTDGTYEEASVTFPIFPSLGPHDDYVEVAAPTVLHANWNLTVRFEDENGLHWCKVTGLPPQKERTIRARRPWRRPLRQPGSRRPRIGARSDPG